jgi:hypothetical protein
MITIRIRTNAGLWRVQLTNSNTAAATATADDVLRLIGLTRPNVVYETPLCRDPACTDPVDTTMSLQAQGLGQNGTMLHCRVDPTTCTTITATTSAGGDGTAAAAAAATNDGAAAPPSTANNNMRRIIDKDGTIRLVPTSEAPEPGKERGFRKGLMALRDMKMHWTCTLPFFGTFVCLLYLRLCVCARASVCCLCCGC